ncbi:unnamed protein product [Bemisia tabaci]|uniref:Myotrophin n=1 Tax=Bemisia tabaci TaxID=7038 RepID=A0A9P0A329_BEMTA|nr:PREDICTED: myotrophin-like [Bemisia tabaci]CAH0383262.1 unnamed protein product [Bemisia tabaci]
MTCNLSEIVWSIKNKETDSTAEFLDRLEKEAGDINPAYNGRNLIHYAADYGNLHTLELLVKKGCDVNIMDKHEITPLLAAIWEGHAKCVKFLIDNGANLSWKTSDGKTYLESTDDEEIKKLVIDGLKKQNLPVA